MLEKEAALFDKEFAELPAEIQQQITPKEKDVDIESPPSQVITKIPGIEPEIPITPSKPIAVEPIPTKPIPPKKQEVPRKEPKEKAQELVMLTSFFPTITEQSIFNEDDSSNIDSSLTVFDYLKARGYKFGTWLISENFDQNNCHKVLGKPVCLKNSGKTFSIDFIINFANEHADAHGYFPPHPFFALAHVNCNCGILCHKPTSLTQIPDTSPGLPMFADRKTINKFKKQIFEKLKDVYVNRWTFMLQSDIDEIFPEDTKARYYDIFNSNPYKEEDVYASSDEIIKTAKWKENIKPISLNEGFLFVQNKKFITPVPSNYFGFQLSSNEKSAHIYLVNLGYVIEVPKNILNYIEIRPINRKPKSFDYIMIDNELGIILSVENESRPLVYLPEFNDVMELDGDYKIFEKIGV